MKSYIKILMVIYLALFNGCINNKIEDIKKDPCICPPDFSTIDYEPAWSPDSETIAYYHFDSVISKTGIYLIAPNGTGNRIWHQGFNTKGPSWSPDGNWLAFSDNGQIWKKKLNGDSLTLLTYQGQNYNPSWSPDGTNIVYNRSYSYPELITVMGIWTFNTSNKSNKQIFKGNSGFPTWITSDTITFVRGDSLILISLITKKLSRIFIRLGESRYPKFSKNNSLLILTSKTINDNPFIWSMNTQGKEVKQLTNNEAYSSDWSPDGKKIAYTDSRAINGRLWIMNSDGTNPIQLTFPSQF